MAGTSPPTGSALRSPSTRRRFVARAAGLLGAGGGAAACGPEAPARPPQASDLRGITVEYWNMWEPTHPEEVARQKVLEGFNRQNQLGVTVITATSAGQTSANMDKVVGALAAGTPPDMTNTFQFNNALFFARGGTVDVDAELKGNPDWARIRPTIYPNVVKGLSWKGKLFAVPSHNSSLLMYYNAAALKRVGLGPPPKTWTWDTFLEYARKANSHISWSREGRSDWSYSMNWNARGAIS